MEESKNCKPKFLSLSNTKKKQILFLYDDAQSDNKKITCIQCAICATILTVQKDFSVM